VGAGSGAAEELQVDVHYGIPPGIGLYKYVPELASGQPALMPLISDGIGAGVTACPTCSAAAASPQDRVRVAPRPGRAVADR